MPDKRKNEHTIDTRFTWSGEKAKEFIELAKEEYGEVLPYGAICQLIRLVCARFVEAKRKENNDRETSAR